MVELRFEWDPGKDAVNRRKHGVPFDEAVTAFDDPDLRRDYDAAHAEIEDRWLVIGLSGRSRLLTVAYTVRHGRIRIITARRSTKAEEGRYDRPGRVEAR